MNAPTIKMRIGLYERLMRLDKPIGSLLLLWPTLWALWIAADGRPRWDAVLVFFVGTVLMRSAGCVMNDISDRRFDPEVKRTRERPLATGAVSVREAVILAASLVLAAFALVLTQNALTVQLSFVALAVAATYPLLKRFFPIPQAYLGIAFGFGIPMAFAAVLGEVPALGWWLLAANILWAIAYDTEYAMVDRDDDMRLNLKSSALLFGVFDVAMVMLCQGIFIAIMAAVGVWLKLGLIYFLGLALALVLIACQFQMIKTRDRDLCLKAFMNNNWVGAAIFACLALDYYLRIPVIK
jgi:4-hydroxybenzoate polyprenyltransferase